jgi:hypothetical protein
MRSMMGKDFVTEGCTRLTFNKKNKLEIGRGLQRAMEDPKQFRIVRVNLNSYEINLEAIDSFNGFWVQGQSVPGKSDVGERC